MGKPVWESALKEMNSEREKKSLVRVRPFHAEDGSIMEYIEEDWNGIGFWERVFPSAD
jgi:hypothetical protein